jgi:ribosomal protein S18 acetylase RimI-like enzyme
MVLDKNKITIIDGDISLAEHQDAFGHLIDVYLNDDMGEKRRLSDDLKDKIISWFIASQCALLFFAKYDKDIVGLSVCFVTFSTFYGRGVLNIHDLIVLPQYRKNGIARRLLEAVEKKAKELDCCKVTLEVREDNHKAMALYQHMGFGPGDHPMYFWKKML